MSETDHSDADRAGLADSAGWVRPGDSPISQTFLLQSFRIRWPAYAIPRWARIAAVAIGILIFGASGWLIWPYYSLHRISLAFRSGDAAALASAVDWISVRQGLRSDISALPESGAVGSTLLDQAIERYVAPQAVVIGGGSNQSKTAEADSRSSRISRFIRAIGGAPWNQIQSTSFTSPFTFQAQVRIPYDEYLKNPSTLVLTWSRGWKVTRIILPAVGLRAAATSISPFANADAALAPRARALLKKKQDYLKSLQIYDFKARYYNSLKGRIAGIQFAMKNNGAETLSMVQVTVYFKDSRGNVLAEQNYLPVDSSVESKKLLKPNQIWQPQQGMFLTAQSVPADWQEGSADIRVTDIEFEGQPALQ